MKIENQCCTLEQAKRLKELGVRQGGLFIWDGFADKIPTIELNFSDGYKRVIAAAFTVAELGCMLPNKFTSYKLTETAKQFQAGNRYWIIETDYNIECDVCCECSSKYHDFTLSKTEAEARAVMLIHLLENNLITAEEVNQRLANS